MLFVMIAHLFILYILKIFKKMIPLTMLMVVKLMYGIITYTSKAIFPVPASHNCGSRLSDRHNSAYIFSLQGLGLSPPLPVQWTPRVLNCPLQSHVQIPVSWTILDVFWGGPFSFPGKTSVDI